MKRIYVILTLAFLTGLTGCGHMGGDRGRTPQNINDVQAQEQEQERYIYGHGGEAFVRESY
jgi:hypothetical protein